MTKSKKAFSFAHLLSFGAARAEGDQGDNGGDQDDERKQGDDESDEDYAKRMEELDKKDAAKGKANAEDDDDDASAADEDDKEKAARTRERARCAAIFGSKAAGSRPDLAAHLAFNTSMSASEAIGMLGAVAASAAPAVPATAAAPRQSLASRMLNVPAQNVGAGAAAAPAANSPQSAAAMIIAAGKARRGEP